MRTLLRCYLPCLLCVALGSVLPAQKLPTPDGSGRIVQMFDAQKLLANDDDPDAPWGYDNDSLQELADFLRRFVEPPLEPTDDLRALGGRWLMLLGSDAQLACTERIFAAAQRPGLLDIKVRIFKMAAKAFDGALKPQLVATERAEQTTFETVVASSKATDLMLGLAAQSEDILQVPQLTVRPLQKANASAVNQTAYVQDFTLTRHGDVLIADPVIATVWDGVRTDVRATFLPGGMIGVACDVQSQELQRPIPTYTTTLAGTPTLPVTIQLPRTTGVRLRQIAHVSDGDLVVLAAQRTDGDYLVAIVQTNAHVR